jgi:hypothetical protein
MEGVMLRCLAVALSLGLSLPAIAAADKPKDKQKKQKGDGDVHVTVVIGSAERESVQTYFVEQHGRGKCPPGLAKKNNGCLPPGQAKKRYVVGQPLPREVVIHELPPNLVIRIGPAPHGYTYGIVDGDLVKLAVGTLLVVDAIDGLVN